MTNENHPLFGAQILQHQMHDWQNPMFGAQIQQNQKTEEIHPLLGAQILQHQMHDWQNPLLNAQILQNQKIEGQNQYHGQNKLPRDLPSDNLLLSQISCLNIKKLANQKTAMTRDNNDAPPHLPKKMHKKLTAKLTKEVSTLNAESEISKDLSNQRPAVSVYTG